MDRFSRGGRSPGISPAMRRARAKGVELCYLSATAGFSASLEIYVSAVQLPFPIQEHNEPPYHRLGS